MAEKADAVAHVDALIDEATVASEATGTQAIPVSTQVSVLTQIKTNIEAITEAV